MFRSAFLVKRSLFCSQNTSLLILGFETCLVALMLRSTFLVPMNTFRISSWNLSRQRNDFAQVESKSLDRLFGNFYRKLLTFKFPAFFDFIDVSQWFGPKFIIVLLLFSSLFSLVRLFLFVFVVPNYRNQGSDSSGNQGNTSEEKISQ